MQEYKDIVKMLAEDKADFSFPNKGQEHAVVVIKEILTTTSIVRMYSGELDSATDGMLESIVSFVDNQNKQFSLILDKNPNDKSDLLVSLCRKNKKIKMANENFRQAVATLSKKNQPYHFLIGDDRAFRIEIDPVEYKAICNFNNSDISKNFISTFDNHFEKLDDYKGC